MNSTKNKKRTKEPRANVFASSLIIRFLGRISSWIYKKTKSSLIGGAATAYKTENAAASGTLAAELVRIADVPRRVFMPIKRGAAACIESSVILGYVRGLLERLLCATMKSYGIFMFSASIYSVLVYLFKLFYLKNAEVDFGIMITVVLMLIASAMMIASRHSLASALRTSPAARFILFKVMGFRKEILEGHVTKDSKFSFAFVAGLLFGAASYCVHPALMLVLIFGLVAAYLVLLKPEIGVAALITVLPFPPTMALVAAVLYITVCYFLKVLCGKRSVKFDLLDAAVLIFMLMMIGGGMVAASSAGMKPMLVYVAFMLAYFLMVNLIRSREWIVRCIVGAIGSCTVVSFWGLYQNFFGVVEKTWQDSDMFSEIAGRVVSTFENPNVLAEYLIMLIPLIIAMFILVKDKRVRLAIAFAGICTGGCLVYTWSRGAWLGFLIGTVIFLLLYNKNTLTALLFCSLGIPFLPFVLPDSIVQRFTSIGNLGDSSTSYRVNIWRGVLNMLGDGYFRSGIGIGNDSFRMVYPGYALSGIETAPHAHNLFLQITVELGIVGLIVFLAVLVLYTQSSLSLHADESRREKLVSTAIFCGMLSVLAQGMTDYIWYNYRVFLMFWLMLGLGAAVRRTLEATAREDVF